MFLAGTVTKMKDIEDIEPTKIAKALKINHSRYIGKLYKPEDFTFKHIWNLAKVLEIDEQLILEVIKKEMNQKFKKAQTKK